MKGWVYVISNKAMPGIVKIGYSTKNPELRATELNHTGSPHPYVVDYEVLVDNPRNVEQVVHRRLRNCHEGKEWFRCTPEEAIASIKEVVGANAQVENFKRADRAKAEAIKRQRDAEERARRAAEEERRKREAALNSKRQEIISRYEPLLEEALPGISFWQYFVGVFIVLGLAIHVLFPKMNDTVMNILSIIGSFIITPFVKSSLENEAKESDPYKSILAKRDAELAAIDREGLRYDEHLQPISRETARHILKEKIIRGLNLYLSPMGIQVELSESAVEFLLDRGYSELYGAREMQRTFDTYVSRPLSEMILKADVKEGQVVKVSAEKENLKFEVI